jgi:Domain of unknown function (DUF4136)
MTKPFVLLLWCLFLAAVAAAQDVRYNFDRDTQFSNFKTYRWVAIKDAAKVGDLLDKQIKSAVDAQLAAKGLTKVDADPADVYVGYQAAVSQEKEFTSYSSGFGGGWGYGPGWYGGGWYGSPNVSSFTSGQTSTIYVGQIVLDMYDSKNHDLVWRGIGSKTIDTKAKPEKQQKNLSKTVTKMLKNYPPVKK